MSTGEIGGARDGGRIRDRGRDGWQGQGATF